MRVMETLFSTLSQPAVRSPDDSLIEKWTPPHRAGSLQRVRLNLRFTASHIAICSCVVLVLVLIARRLLSQAQVRWYHASSTVKWRLKQGRHVELLHLCKWATPPCFLNPFLQNSHLQTLLFMFDNRAFPLHFRRMIFTSHNREYQGTFAVDLTVPAFVEHDSELPPRTAYYQGNAQSHVGSNDRRPMLVVLHGLCGGSHEQYLQHVLAPLVAGKQKWEACVVLSRGCGQSTITGGGMYHAHATSDVEQVIKWLRIVFPNRALYGAGFSMGANILTRYIAEQGDDCLLKAAVVISNPWNLETTALHLQRTFLGRWLYSPAMTAGLMDIFSRNKKKIQTKTGEPIDLKPASQVHLLHEYDRHIQCQTWGYPTERVYYRQASSSDSVLQVRIPFWAINAEDDPIVGEESLPKEEFHASPYTVMCTTDGGGHLGWFQRNGQRWYARAMIAFYQRMHDMEDAVIDL